MSSRSGDPVITRLYPPPSGVSLISAADISAFRAAVNDSFVPLRVSSSRADRFHGSIRAARTGDVHLTDIRAGAHVVERTPELVSRNDRPYFKVSLMLAGTGLLIQDQREATLRPGDLAVYDTSRPYTLEFGADFRTLVLMFPRNLVALPAEIIGQLTAVRISGSDGLGAVVAPYLTQLGEHLEQLTGSTGARLAHSALDLVTTVFARELGFDEASDPHRALFEQIRTYIDAHLSDSGLTPGSIAAAHYISTRHLHALFQEHGTTVSTWVRMRRLEQCRRDLGNPLHAAVAVAAIAARWGFADAAHFSRAFKAAFAVSPSEYRAHD